MFRDVPKAIFRIDVMDDINNNCFIYTTKLNEFVIGLLDIFENGLKIIGDVEVIEKKIMPDLFKTSPALKLKVPILPRSEPERLS